MFILDTNVVSELRKPSSKAEAKVVQWVGRREPSLLYLSAITLYELEVGARRLERRDGRSGKHLRRWIDERVRIAFEGRILAFDVEAARTAAALQVPDPRSERDMYIAATAIVHGVTVVTRNMKDFWSSGVALVNPWQSR